MSIEVVNGIPLDGRFVNWSLRGMTEPRISCSLCGRPTRLLEGATQLPVRHIACHEAFMVPIDCERLCRRAAELGRHVLGRSEQGAE